MIHKAFDVNYTQKYITAGSHTINTIIAGSGSPIVLLHGFGAGVGLWVYNLKVRFRKSAIYLI